MASAKRESSVTTAESPIRIKPPVSAVAPAHSSAVPSVDSLSETPNPIVARPHAATTTPRINNNTAIGLRPARTATLRKSPLSARSPRTSTRRLLWLANNFDPISHPSAITIVAVCLTTWNLLNAQLNAVSQPRRAIPGYFNQKWYSLHCPRRFSDLIESAKFLPSRACCPNWH